MGLTGGLCTDYCHVFFVRRSSRPHHQAHDDLMEDFPGKVYKDLGVLRLGFSFPFGVVP